MLCWIQPVHVLLLNLASILLRRIKLFDEDDDDDDDDDNNDDNDTDDDV